MTRAQDDLRETMNRRDAQGLGEVLGDRPGTDGVHLPEHYARWKIEVMRFIVENNGPGFLYENATKYLWRYDAKDGHKDLAKAARYVEMLRLYEAGCPTWWAPQEASVVAALPVSPDAPLRSKPCGQ